MLAAGWPYERLSRPPTFSLETAMGHLVGGQGLGITRVQRLAAPSVWTVPHAMSASRATLGVVAGRSAARPLEAAPAWGGSVQRRGQAPASRRPLRPPVPRPERPIPMSLLLVGDLSAFEALCAAAQDDRPHPEQAQLEQ